MIQHGEGEARFSNTSGEAASGTVTGTRLFRPDRFDGCWNCKKRYGDKCPKYPYGLAGLSARDVCEKWKIRT